MSDSNIVSKSMSSAKAVLYITALLTALVGVFIFNIKVDADPENMLPHDQPDRVLHDEIKKRFDLYDLLVVGVVNTSSDKGVYDLATLKALHALTTSIVNIDGVIEKDVMSLSTIDNISQEGPGTIRFQWMMNHPPANQAEAEQIKASVNRLPMMSNTIVSGDHKAAAIYVPITAKTESYRIANEIRAIVTAIDAPNTDIHITGLPVAEDTFGIEMFIQMAISAPLAALVIFAMMWWFFRSVTLITAPMIMAMATVIITMGILIGLGFTVHIMSSMIPIFLMPIAVVDSVHVLSEFSDRYRLGASVKDTLLEVMSHLLKPMLFTSITSAVGFATLALTPIPPVQIFGLHVAFGIMTAFVLTITFIPAYVVLLPEKALKGMVEANEKAQAKKSGVAAAVEKMGQLANRKPLVVLALVGVMLAGGFAGISRININDNPVRWFRSHHEIRVADKVLNEHFAGTYNAFLTFKHQWSPEQRTEFLKAFNDFANANGSTQEVLKWRQILTTSYDDSLLQQLNRMALQMERLADESDSDFWYDLFDLVDEKRTALHYFKSPQALSYITDMQAALNNTGWVGKSSGLPDLVKTVYRELQGGSEEHYKLPETPNAVAQTILSFQSSHRPQDVWRMVTKNFDSTAVWLQLNSGDNQDMSKVIAWVDQYTQKNPLPKGVSVEWGGLTYINVVWQNEMVAGMMDSLLGAFLIVALMMVILFRSAKTGLLAIIPLSITIISIYGVIGWIRKDYDMPIAVLSALTLGLSVDFAIHFLERAREEFRKHGDWETASKYVFAEPAKAITRNALVIAIGFLPLLFAPLVPYNTVGLFLASIMAASALVTLLVLPALIRLSNGRLLA